MNSGYSCWSMCHAAIIVGASVPCDIEDRRLDIKQIEIAFGLFRENFHPLKTFAVAHPVAGLMEQGPSTDSPENDVLSRPSQALSL